MNALFCAPYWIELMANFCPSATGRNRSILLKKSAVVSTTGTYAFEIEIFTLIRGFRGQISRSNAQKRRFQRAVWRNRLFQQNRPEAATQSRYSITPGIIDKIARYPLSSGAYGVKRGPTFLCNQRRPHPCTRKQLSSDGPGCWLVGLPSNPTREPSPISKCPLASRFLWGRRNSL
jgi:hypothetical protein